MLATNILDSRVLQGQQADLADRISTVVNWAYRGKHPENDQNAWTTERHLLSGIRTTAPDVQSMLLRAAEETAEARALLLATVPDGDDNSATAAECVVGTIQVESCGEGEAELGLFSVDPDLQGCGIGKALLTAAERHAAEQMSARLAVLYVLRSRADLLGWYARCGYETTTQVVPFPTDANVGTPRPGLGFELDFVRLEKRLM